MPHITALNASGQSAATKPLDVRGTIVDGSNGRPIAGAHVVYNQQVVDADAAGAFDFPNVPAGKALDVVAAGYRRFVGTWNPAQSQIKLVPFTVHAIYMPFSGLTTPSILATVDKDTLNTEINAVVLEIKTDNGFISPQMATPAAEAAHAVEQNSGDLRAFVQKMHDRGIYMIGRFVVFRDDNLAALHPDWALRYQSNGQPYKDGQGNEWMDAFRQETWQYNLDIAVKAAQLGFDEIQFDYVRFAGSSVPLIYAEPMTEENRVAAIAGFLKEADERLRPYGVALGADSFGQTTIATDDTGIGQDITTLGKYLDYYCPMVYPSTWADGSFGVDYPAADPYTIVLKSVQSAIKRLSAMPNVRVRPWLQAFDDYNARQLDYTDAMINTQKTAADTAGADGWMLWHPLSHYDAGIIGPAPTTTPTASP